MSSSSEIHRFIVEQESSPAVRGSPREAVLTAVERAEAVAFSKGVELALSRIEMLVAIVPGRISGAEVIRMAACERDAIIGEWRKRFGIEPATPSAPVEFSPR